MLVIRGVRDWIIFEYIGNNWGKAMANYPQELAQDAVCQSHNRSHDWGLVPASPASKAEY